jgi:nicotinate phosphoribosyltransferase
MYHIIESLLDSDTYKFSMMQAVLHQFPAANVRYKFKCRNKGVKFTMKQGEKITKEINHLCTLRFSEDELRYLGSIYFFKTDFIDFLRNFQLQFKHIDIQLTTEGELKIVIEGPWLHTILFETPVLAIVNEVYFDNGHGIQEMVVGTNKFFKKVEIVRNNFGNNANTFQFADFGTRRRYSTGWHRTIVQTFVEKIPNQFIGTSNVLFAKMFNTKPIGTMAHEWIQAGQALTDIRNSQKFMLQKWADEYRGDLGIALSDTLGLDVFLRDFDGYFAKLFDGVRQDSGDPFEAGDKIIKHYEKLRIDPRTKTIVFSDSLDIPTAISLYNHFSSRIKVSFGIGTNLTNDLEREPLNIVIKMTHCNGQPVAKISDNEGKGMCENETYLKFLKSVINKENKK